MDLDFGDNICHHRIPDTFASFLQLMRNFEDDYRARRPRHCKSCCHDYAPYTKALGGWSRG